MNTNTHRLTEDKKSFEYSKYFVNYLVLIYNVLEIKLIIVVLN